MARKQLEEERIELDGLPKETIAAVVIAQMFQVQAIADTLSSASDKHLLYVASNVVLDLLNGYTTPHVVAAIPQIQAILSTKPNGTQ
jgi:hypothetical protein